MNTFNHHESSFLKSFKKFIKKFCLSYSRSPSATARIEHPNPQLIFIVCLMRKKILSFHLHKTFSIATQNSNLIEIY